MSVSRRTVLSSCAATGALLGTSIAQANDSDDNKEYSTNNQQNIPVHFVNNAERDLNRIQVRVVDPDENQLVNSAVIDKSDHSRSSRSEIRITGGNSAQKVQIIVNNDIVGSTEVQVYDSGPMQSQQIAVNLRPEGRDDIVALELI